jgi:MFS family permease
MPKAPGGGRFVTIYWLSCVMFGISTSIFDALYALHLRALGLGEDQIGFVFGFGSAIMATTLVVMIGMSKRFSVGSMFKWSTALFAACMSVFPFLVTFPAHLVTFCVCSVGSAIMMSTGTAAMLEHVQHAARSRFFNSYFVVFLASSAAGTSIIALVHYARSSGSEVETFTGALILSGLLSGVMAIARISIKFSTGIREDANAAERHTNNKLMNSAFYLTFALSSFTGASAVLSIRFANLLLVERLHLTVDQTLLWLTAERIVSFVTLVFLAERFKSSNQYVTSAILMGLSAIFLAFASFASVPSIFGVLYLARQATHYSQQPLLEQISFEGVAVAERARAGFMRRLGLFVGSSIGALLYGWLIADGAATSAILLAAGFALFAAITYALRASGVLPLSPPEHAQ